jgi:hypothetical protein
MVMWLCVMAAFAAEGEWQASSRYASAFGPDAWGMLSVDAGASDALHVGARFIGGSRIAALGAFGGTLRLRPIEVSGTALLGVRRTHVEQEGGPVAGFETRVRLTATDELDAVGSLEVLPGIGGWFEGGVDADVAHRWTLQPRLAAGTWAGDRDPAIRVELGLDHRFLSGFFVSAAASAGGRDTVHMGPGARLALGRRL